MRGLTSRLFNNVKLIIPLTLVALFVFFISLQAYSSPVVTADSDSNSAQADLLLENRAPRGRVQIDANNNLVADNGYPLRGESMFVTDPSGSTTGNFTLAYLYDQSYWLALRDDFHMNTIRLFISRPPQNWPGGPGTECWPWSPNPYRCYPLDYQVNPPDTTLDIIDDVVAMAGQMGMYIIVDYHPVGGYIAQDAFDWWNQIAPRYKDETHVIYEAANEPVAWNASNYTATDIQFQEDIYAHIRALAPNTHITLWTFANCSGPMKAKVDLGSDIVYSNASVSCHPYSYDASGVTSLRSAYPFVKSEIGGGSVQADVIRAENLGVSWIGLGVAKTHNVSPNGFDPEDVTWPADPGATGGPSPTPTNTPVATDTPVPTPTNTPVPGVTPTATPHLDNHCYLPSTHSD